MVFTLADGKYTQQIYAAGGKLTWPMATTSFFMPPNFRTLRFQTKLPAYGTYSSL